MVTMIAVIPRKGEALTWESPGTIFVPAVQVAAPYREIAPQAFPSVPRRFAPRNDIRLSLPHS